MQRHGGAPRRRRSTIATDQTVSPPRRAVDQRRRDGRRVADPPILAPPLNALVAILVQVDKVLPQLLLPLLDDVALAEILEPLFEPADGRAVEFVLVRFQIAQLREVLAALVQLASVGLGGRVDDLVRAHVAVLCEGLAARLAVVGPLAGVAAFVGFEVAQLAETLAASGFLA